MVVHNWFTKPSCNILPQTTNIDGIIILSKKNQYAPHGNGDVYFDFNLNSIDSNLAHNRDYFIIMHGDKNTQINIDKFIKISNRHFEYIITWFTFAFFAFSIAVIYFKKNHK